MASKKTKEGLTWRNPIKIEAGNAGQAKAARIFNNQVPGLFVTEATQFPTFGASAVGGATFVCTRLLTANNEPIWVKVSVTLDGKPAVLASYFIYVKYIDKDTSQTLTASRTLVNYENSSKTSNLKKRQGYSQFLGNTRIFGKYVFLGLSASDLKRIKAKSGEIRKGIENLYLNSELLLTMETVPAALQKLYEFMSSDSNGRSGPMTIREFEGFNPGTGTGTGTSSSGNRNPSANSRGRQPNKELGIPASKPVTVKILDARIMSNGNNSTAYNSNERRPYMEQKYFVFSSEGKQEITRRHVFDVIPNSFEFSQLSSTWNEVERSGNYPLVDWAKYNLTKVSFKFLVHGTREDKLTTSTGVRTTTVNDGLDKDVDEQLDNLRSIGGAPHLVRIYNMNTFLTDSYRYPYLQKAGAIQWAIGDMSVSATRLTPYGSKIATAEVSLTLVEYPVVGRDIIALPPLSPTKPIIPGPQTTPTPAQYGSFTENTLTWPAPDEPVGYTSSKSEPED
jgi:hypothetical protein